MLKIVIVDDHYLIREGIKKIIKADDQMVVTGEFEGGSELLEFIMVNDFDLIILDINLPERNGLDVLKDIKAIKPASRVLMLSIYPEEQFAIRAIKAGATGYITKDSQSADFIKAIRRTSSGRKYVSENLAESLVDEIASPSTESAHKKLSDREYEILLLLGSGGKSREVAKKLSLSMSTVNTYKARILTKMKMKSTSELIRYVIANGLLNY